MRRVSLAEHSEKTEQQKICQLIRALQKGEPTAFDDLMLCYGPLLKRMIGNFSGATVLCEAEKEDLRQEAAIALYKAALSFDTDQTNVTFGLYAKICVRNRLVSAIRHMERKKRKEKSNSPREVSFSSWSSEQSKREIGKFLAEAGDVLSPKEQIVLRLYFSGLSYKEISKELNCTLKSVDNALSRAKKKLKEARENQIGNVERKMPAESL